MKNPETLGELKQSSFAKVCESGRSVKAEMRENLLRQLEAGRPLFPGIIGYDDSVVPQIINAILSKHNMILLGLRGQAKSRILRALTSLLDEELPVVAGCEIHDNPFRPLCRSCFLKIEELGDRTPVTYLQRDQRYVEKLATPDVTIADIIGDVDPIRAAKAGLQLSDVLTMHYGLLPRANRGIFALNELPDLAGKIQVGLLNILQEGDVQIKGYPVRLNLDVVLVFTANPEDYTARGKIITPLKDRIGSEIRTHYPREIETGLEITKQEAWIQRYPADRLHIPTYIAEVVEAIAFEAREDKRVDKRSGVSQRLPITALENVVSNSERRAILNHEKKIVPRIGDVYAAVPALTGKLELEYEGELKGADTVARELIRAGVARVFSKYFHTSQLQQIVDWFELGGSLKISDMQPAGEAMKQLRTIQGLLERTSELTGRGKVEPEVAVSAAEFLLEGLYANRKISRSEEKGFFGAERKRTEVLRDEAPRGHNPYQ
ncbi:MAG: sigma 54-interacting transcriptional regulator [Acidobacteriia bacterium]|nr:sigma 54-interacting transcriptional regulator [Terriglobia bacterium]